MGRIGLVLTAGDDQVVTRRNLLIGLGAASLSMASPAFAQRQAGKIPRIGVLWHAGSAEEEKIPLGALMQGFTALGYIDSKNIVFEHRFPNEQPERFVSLAAELARLNVDVLVAVTRQAALAAQSATQTIPIVFMVVPDPVGSKLVDSLARPGGSSTGLTSIAPDLEGKRLELLREVVPKLSRVSFLLNPDNAFHVGSEKQARAAAQVVHLDVQFVGVRMDSDFDHAFNTIARERPDAFIVFADRVFLHNRGHIVDFAARNRLPAVYPYRELVEAGGLVSFGPNYAEMHRRAATYVDKILKGAKPADLPVEQPTKFELIINPKSAKALGVTIPQALLLRADEIIQ